MIARTWHGMVPIEMRDSFEEYEYQTGVKDTLAIKGNQGAFLKIVEQGEYAHFFLCTKWDSMASMIAYAGNNPTIAVTYPEDEKYGLISDPIVIIQEFVDDGDPFVMSNDLRKTISDLEIPKTMIKPPKKIPLLLRIGLFIAKRETGKDLMPARLLTWYPRAAIGSGVLEMMTAKGKNEQEQRLLNLVRLQASLICSCSFCIDMNSAGIVTHGITEEELAVLQGQREVQSVQSFSLRELLALEYAISLSSTPPNLSDQFIKNMTREFSEKEIVMLASTIASVNYWARLNQGLGIPRAGFSDRCLLYHKYE